MECVLELEEIFECSDALGQGIVFSLYIHDRPRIGINVSLGVFLCLKFAHKIVTFAVLKQRLLQQTETETSFV